MTDAKLNEFAAAYARHRASEGRGQGTDTIRSLPWPNGGPMQPQWAIRARTYDTFLDRVLNPMAGRALDVLDLGAGNAWLAWRMVEAGHRAIAVDIRDDDVDGLGAAQPLVDLAAGRLVPLVASFDAVPLPDACADMAVFNAALHYATDLAASLREACRLVRPGGRVVILDSPFYAREADGLAMVAEKQAHAAQTFGADAALLTGMGFIEFLTRERLVQASAALGLAWRRHRVRYPLGYEFRPLKAWLRRQRAPSRFDVWSAVRP